MTVETLRRLTDADIRVLGYIEDTIGRSESFTDSPEGAPEPIVQRLVGLGVLRFDGLYKGLSQLGCLILDDLRSDGPGLPGS